MFNKETSEKLQGLGFDVSKLTEAAKADDEQGLDVPAHLKTADEIGKLKTDEQYTTFGANRFNEGKTAFSEIKAKELKETHKIDIDGKDIDAVIDAMIEAKVKETGETPKEWATDKKKLQDALKHEQEARKTDNTTYSQKLRTFEQRGAVSSLVDTKKETKIAKSEVIDLFFLQHHAEIIDGRTVWFKGEDKLIDDALEPIKTEAVFAAFMDSGNYYVGSGMGGDDDNDGSGSSGKFKSLVAFTAYCEKNKINPASEEGQKLLKDKRDESVSEEAFYNAKA